MASLVQSLIHGRTCLSRHCLHSVLSSILFNHLPYLRLLVQLVRISQQHPLEVVLLLHVDLLHYFVVLRLLLVQLLLLLLLPTHYLVMFLHLLLLQITTTTLFLPHLLQQLSTTTNSSITPSSGVHLNHGRLCTALRCELWCELWCELLVLSALMCCEDDALDGNRVPSVGVSDMVYTCQAFLYRWWCCVLHETGARAARVWTRASVQNCTGLNRCCTPQMSSIALCDT